MPGVFYCWKCDILHQILKLTLRSARRRTTSKLSTSYPNWRQRPAFCKRCHTIAQILQPCSATTEYVLHCVSSLNASVNVLQRLANIQCFQRDPTIVGGCMGFTVYRMRFESLNRTAISKGCVFRSQLSSVSSWQCPTWYRGRWLLCHRGADIQSG